MNKQTKYNIFLVNRFQMAGLLKTDKRIKLIKTAPTEFVRKSEAGITYYRPSSKFGLWEVEVNLLNIS